MQELNLQTTLPAVSFDAEALKSWALALTEKYNGLVVTEDAVVDVKRDMAELNKKKQSLDDARKETVRQVSAPIGSGCIQLAPRYTKQRLNPFQYPSALCIHNLPPTVSKLGIAVDVDLRMRSG